MPGGRLPGSRYAACAISATVHDRVGVPAHARDARRRRRCRRARPPAGGRRSRSPSAGAAAPRPGSRRRRIGPLRLPPVPNANGRLVGVALVHRDVVERRRRGTRLTSCAVVVSRPCPCDPEPRYTSTVPSGWTRMVRRLGAVAARSCSDGSMYRPMPTPRQPPSPRAARLLGAERVVVEHRRGLLERLGGRHVDRRRCRAAVVYGKLVARDHVAAAQLERVDAEPRGDDVDHLLARAGLHHPRPAVGAAPAGVGAHGLRLEARASGCGTGPVKMTAAHRGGAAGADGNAPTSSRWSTSTPRMRAVGVDRHRDGQRSPRAWSPAMRFSRRSSIHFTAVPRCVAGEQRRRCSSRAR